MLLNFTEFGSDNLISINPTKVISVFSSIDENTKGSTVLLMSGGHFLIKENILDVIGQINGELRQ